MKKNQLTLLTLLIPLFSSCYSSKISYNNMDNIQRGMSPTQVKAILGKPNYRSFDEKGEMLEFRNFEYGTAKVIKIKFIDSKVVEMESYLDQYNENYHSKAQPQKEKKEDQPSDKDTSSRVQAKTTASESNNK